MPTLPGLQLHLVPVIAFASALFCVGSHAQDDDLPPPPPLTGTIYFDPWQLEKEFVVSPLVLQEWIDLGLTAEGKLDAAQRNALKPKIGEFLGERCPVTVKGEPIDFTLDRIHFIEPNDREFVLIEPDAVVSPTDIRISVIFAAPNTDLEAPLQLLWDLFPPGQPFVLVAAADVAGTRMFRAAQVAPSITVAGRYEVGARKIPKAPPAPEDATWTIPWLSILLILCAVPVGIRIVRSEKPGVVALVIFLGLAGGAAAARKFATFPIQHPFRQAETIDAEQSSVILAGTLRGVYHSFNFRDKKARYGTLAKVVGNEALETIFLEVERTLESRERDGARVRVNDLKVEESQPRKLADRRGFETDCSWQVKGRVGHWGHFHDRSNRYRATIVVEPLAESWKITGLTLHAKVRDTEPAP